jgi:hypothetical protein
LPQALNDLIGEVGHGTKCHRTGGKDDTIELSVCRYSAGNTVGRNAGARDVTRHERSRDTQCTETPLISSDKGQCCSALCKKTRDLAAKTASRSYDKD